MNEFEAIVATLPRLPKNRWDAEETETKEADQDALDFKLVQASLDGKYGNAVRDAVEKRMQAVQRVTGCTLAALEHEEPGRHRRFLRGCRVAVRRQRLIETGDLSRGELEQLKRQELDRRVQRQNGDLYDALDQNFGDYAGAPL